ncbi:unnamed protein product [Lasius platythorax]|uniref:Uncharacterized protein n=1 Tax=Lasius platythorax TaxID=488582 RepID=A0AAV2MYQ0_9HYME
MVVRLMCVKEIFNNKPTKPKYEEIYDLEPVLQELEKLFPLESLSLTELTNKLIISLALVTAHRKQTLSLIKVSNIRKTKKGYEIKILDKMKVTRPGAYQLLLVIPKLETKPALCVANTLERYLLVTNELRSDCDNLLLTTRSPYKKATKTPLVDGYEPS